MIRPAILLLAWDSIRRRVDVQGDRVLPHHLLRERWVPRLVEHKWAPILVVPCLDAVKVGAEGRDALGRDRVPARRLPPVASPEETRRIRFPPFWRREPDHRVLLRVRNRVHVLWADGAYVMFKREVSHANTKIGTRFGELIPFRV